MPSAFYTFIFWPSITLFYTELRNRVMCKNKQINRNPNENHLPEVVNLWVPTLFDYYYCCLLESIQCCVLHRSVYVPARHCLSFFFCLFGSLSRDLYLQFISTQTQCDEMIQYNNEKRDSQQEVWFAHWLRKIVFYLKWILFIFCEWFAKSIDFITISKMWAEFPTPSQRII